MLSSAVPMVHVSANGSSHCARLACGAPAASVKLHETVPCGVAFAATVGLTAMPPHGLPDRFAQVFFGLSPVAYRPSLGGVVAPVLRGAGVVIVARAQGQVTTGQGSWLPLEIVHAQHDMFATAFQAIATHSRRDSAEIFAWLVPVEDARARHVTVEALRNAIGPTRFRPPGLNRCSMSAVNVFMATLPYPIRSHLWRAYAPWVAPVKVRFAYKGSPLAALPRASRPSRCAP